MRSHMERNKNVFPCVLVCTTSTARGRISWLLSETWLIRKWEKQDFTTDKTDLMVLERLCFISQSHV